MGIYKFSASSGFGTKTRYASMLAGNPVFVEILGSYESIATVTVGAGGSSGITFSSIPQTYRHLQLRGLDQQYYGVNDRGYTAVRLNGDSGANYSRHQLWTTGSSAAAYASTANYYGYAGFSALIGPTAPRTLHFAANIIDILDYRDTTKYKTIRGFGGQDFNGSGDVGIISSLWPNTAAVTSITIPNINGNFQQGSTYALYGIRG